MPGKPETLSADAALQAYQNLGPQPFIGEIPFDESSAWVESCGGAELNAEQVFDVAWLAIERGFNIQTSIDKSLSKRGRDQRYRDVAGLSRIASRQYGFGLDLLEKLMDDDTASPYLQAQVHLTYPAVPILEAVPLPSNFALKRDRLMNAYKLGIAGAVGEMHSLIDSGAELSNDERIFVQALGHITIANSLSSNGVIMLPVPNRCYQGLSAENGWQGLLWDGRRNQRAAVTMARTSTLQYVIPLLSHIYEGDQPGDSDGIELLHDLFLAMSDVEHPLHDSALIATATHGLASYLRRSTKGKQTAALQLPRLDKYVEWPEAVTAPSQIVDLDPLQYPEINVSTLTEDNLLVWYSAQVNGRSLTTQEGLTINRVLTEFCKPNMLDRLTTSDLLILNKIRLDCAIALIGGYESVALKHLGDALGSTQSIQKSALADRDIVSLYEAALDDLRMRILGNALRGEELELSPVELEGEMIDLLIEIDSEKGKVNKYKDQRIRLKELAGEMINTVIMMHFSGDESLIALPCYGREKGSEALPGWSVNLWKMNSGRVDLSANRKLRISGAVSRHMRQGDIGLIPLDVIKKSATVTDIAKNLKILAIASSDEKSRRRAQTLVDRWRDAIQPSVDGAIQLVDEVA